jgi:hypothetical protein
MSEPANTPATSATGAAVGESVNSAEIMERVRAAIRARRASSGLSEAEFDALAAGTPAQPTLDDLRQDLGRLTEALRYSGVEMLLSDVRPSPLSGLVQRARAMLHEVVLFYVNRAAMQQAAVNRLTLQSLKTALALIEAQQARIAELKTALALIEAQQARIAELEARESRPPGPPSSAAKQP